MHRCCTKTKHKFEQLKKLKMKTKIKTILNVHTCSLISWCSLLPHLPFFIYSFFRIPLLSSSFNAWRTYDGSPGTGEKWIRIHHSPWPKCPTHGVVGPRLIWYRYKDCCRVPQTHTQPPHTARPFGLTRWYYIWEYFYILFIFWYYLHSSTGSMY